MDRVLNPALHRRLGLVDRLSGQLTPLRSFHFIVSTRPHPALHPAAHARESQVCYADPWLSRRGALQRTILPVLLPFMTALQSLAMTTDDMNKEVWQMQAIQAYANREFDTATDFLSKLISIEPHEARWYEMRGQVLVDKKEFKEALADYNAALARTPGSDLANTARLKVGRGLAYEGLSAWDAALNDYNDAIASATRAGLDFDPYVINSRGNCNSSLGRYQDARQDYLLSARIFQQAKGLRGRNGSTTQRLDGAVYASSNAALMLAQLGNEDAALDEMRRVARRAPGSVDMRAALAAMYWARGDSQGAEEQWQYACDMITAGCSKYEDEDWLTRVRRWPPVMAAKLHNFLTLQNPV